ncbi:MAG: histidine--tRNA ligase [Candidatus Omnitrophica bacterium]|nr:histidine--tRNA ligase [Candidatus Omnitrophota bacterium]
MTSKFQSFPGMDDILPGEIEKWQWAEEKARVFFEANGFKELRTPILEPTELFVRSIGQASDIVHKEMFSLKDRGDRDMTMRPEMTASVARAVIEKGLLKTAKSLRLYYIGPMFRAERPQAGRKRQFHQIGAEIVNEDARADFEIIALVYRFLQYTGLKNIFLHLNDLGEEEDRKKVRESLAAYFSKEKAKLCKDCQYRLEKNVLRVFDCKVRECQPVIEKAPWEDFFPLSARFQELAKKLEADGIPFQVNRRLVRGLDYYNGTVFEITAEGLGAQNAVAGGGRYDHLYQDLGGSATPCTGFSIGMERLLASLESQDPEIFKGLNTRKVYIAPLEENPALLRLCREKAVALREAGIRIESCAGVFSLSQHLKKANQSGARYMMIAGPDELAKKKVVVKDLERREQVEIDNEQIISHFKKATGLC